MKFLPKKYKPVLAFFIILQLFVLDIAPAFALFGAPSVPSASKILSDMEKRYHLNVESIQEQGENMNVASSKGLYPEVMLYFSPNDPKEGEKLTAKAFPLYFSNAEPALYYTWILKRAGCDLKSTDTDCDEDGDGKVTVEDWKITAARIIALNGYTQGLGPLSGDEDNDGYLAHFGGDDKLGMNPHCYINDPISGDNYELVKPLGNIPNFGFGCPKDQSPICLIEDVDVHPESLSITSSAIGGTGTGGTAGTSGSSTGGTTTCTTDGSGVETCVTTAGSGTAGTGGTGGSATGGSAAASGSGPVFSYSSSTCSISGYPSCSQGVPKCNVGEPRCLADASSSTQCGSTLSSCSVLSEDDVKLDCHHLFPNIPGYTSGDGKFFAGEETKWGTNPSDPSTADNENKDEANVVGLNQTSFTWNYQPGDEVSVFVEGSTLAPTKYDDSSRMIMWAFPKKDCPLSMADNIGAYVKSIKGYDVIIPITDIDHNKCIEKNLVDPREGGQATRLDVSVSASSSEAINDPGSDKSGDLVVVQAAINNAGRDLKNILFEWKVESAPSISNFLKGSGIKDITEDLQTKGLLGSTKGNALDTISVKLDLPSLATGYLRFKLDATESFPKGGIRKGNSDVIIHVTSTEEKINVFQVIPQGTGKKKVELNTDSRICNGTTDPSEKIICRVIKNEIIGLKVDIAGLSNFYWTINGKPLVCNKRVSGDCENDQQTNVNFFPVTGNVGDTYTVVVTANDTVSGKLVTLTRAFNVVEPKVVIKSADKNVLWPKYLGQYKDIANLGACSDDGYCEDYSESIYEAYNDTTQVTVERKTIPGFLENQGTFQSEWGMNGIGNTDSNVPTFKFDIDKSVSRVYEVTLFAQYVQSDDIRKALLDIWGISPFESPEIKFSSSIEVNVVERGDLLADGPLVGPRKYYAAIASYIPASLLFTFRIVLSVVLLLFVVNILYSFLEQRRVEDFVESNTRFKR